MRYTAETRSSPRSSRPAVSTPRAERAVRNGAEGAAVGRDGDRRRSNADAASRPRSVSARRSRRATTVATAERRRAQARIAAHHVDGRTTRGRRVACAEQSTRESRADRRGRLDWPCSYDTPRAPRRHRSRGRRVLRLLRRRRRDRRRPVADPPRGFRRAGGDGDIADGHRDHGVGRRRRLRHSRGGRRRVRGARRDPGGGRGRSPARPGSSASASAR